MSGFLFVQLLAFESYRDLVRMLQQNLTEEQGLIAAELQNIEERASARSAAAAAIGLAAGQSSGPAASAAPAGACDMLLELARYTAIPTVLVWSKHALPGGNAHMRPGCCICRSWGVRCCWLLIRWPC